MVYYGHFTWSDTIKMTRLELNWFHTKLIEIKNKEKEDHDKAMAEIGRNKKNSSRSLPKSRPKSKMRRR